MKFKFRSMLERKISRFTLWFLISGVNMECSFSNYKTILSNRHCLSKTSWIYFILIILKEHLNLFINYQIVIFINFFTLY